MFISLQRHVERVKVGVNNTFKVRHGYPDRAIRLDDTMALLQET
jgi:hypothetical protein